MKGKILRNKYIIIEILGQDTFSETFLAQDKRQHKSDRYVIKKFRPILGNPQASKIRDLFDREASVLQLLSGENPQIPKLYEYFTEGEVFYLVREWIEGITLEQKVRQQGKLSESEVRQILDSILSVLKYIHNQGIVYRQLKPSSIVLRQGNESDRVTETDLPVPIYFGGVKQLELELDRHQPSLVLTSQEEYIPPEQQQGQSVYASDLYSLGLTAIYLLTGKTPAELNCDPYTKRLLWQQEVPDLSINLVRAIDRAISPRTGDRFTNSEEMLQALNSQSVTISASLITQPDTDKKPWLTLTPEIRIISILFSVGLGVLGIAFAILNLDFSQLFQDNNQGELLTNTRIETLPQNIPSLSNLESEASLNIPIFRIGTPQEQVIDSMGQPSQESTGYWGNSRAFSYRDFIRGQVDLGYLADSETQTIRQTEISFADSVKLADIKKAMQLLLLDNYSAEIERQIDLVFSQKSSQERFKLDNLRGVIQRNPQNRIYVAVWDRGFQR